MPQGPGLGLLSPPTGSLFQSAATPENPSLPSGGFRSAAELCTRQERLWREEGEGETEAGAQGGSVDPSACRQHPTSIPKDRGPCCIHLAGTQECPWPLCPSPVASCLQSRSGSGLGSSLGHLCSGLPDRELRAGPAWETLSSFTFIPYTSPSSRGASKINSGIKKAFWRQIDAFCFPSNASK